MKRPGTLAAAAAVLACAGIAGFGVFAQIRPAADMGIAAGTVPDGSKPDMVLMTSLPLIWGETGMDELLSGGAKPHPFYDMLQQSYDVTAVDSLAPGAVLQTPGKPDLLLLAQPRPLTPAELVAVDNWVRAGGRAIILADPMLLWDSRYPIGDKRRPQAVSLLTPLFRRWGLDYTFDEDADGGLVSIEAGPYKVLGRGIGSFARAAQQDGAIADCAVADVPILARCRIGKGKAIILADADLLDTPLAERSDNFKFVGALLGEIRK